ncbi:hypothetical protein KCU73_g321, partial [Aureobasidium melanogenum]
AIIEDEFSKHLYLRTIINDSQRLGLNVPVIWQEFTTPPDLLHTAFTYGGTVITAPAWVPEKPENVNFSQEVVTIKVWRGLRIVTQPVE